MNVYKILDECRIIYERESESRTKNAFKNACALNNKLKEKAEQLANKQGENYDCKSKWKRI